MLAKLRRLAFTTVGTIAAFSLTAAGCAPTANQRPAAGASAKSSEFETALKNARTRRADVESASPPAYSGDGSKPAAEAYMVLLKKWVIDIKTRLHSAVEAYAGAARLAPDADAEMAVILEALDVAQQTQRRFMDAAEGAAPSDFQTVAGLMELFRLRLED